MLDGISTPALAEESFHIPVFIQGDTIVLYEEHGSIKLATNLSIPRCNKTSRYISIPDLHATRGKDWLRGVCSGKNTPDLDGFYDSLKREFPLNTEATNAAERMREDFYIVYNQLPIATKALAEATGVRAIIALPGNKMSSVVGSAGYDACVGLLWYSDTFFLTRGALDYFTVLEEISHAVDEHIGRHANAGCFSQSKSWRQALTLDLASPNPLARILYIYAEEQKTNSANALKESDEHRSVEALVDIMIIEEMLIRHMMEHGNLSDLSQLIKPHDTIDDVAMRAIPNLWQLYRGAQNGRGLVQDNDGFIGQIERGARMPAGSKPTISYPEACQQTLNEFCREDIIAASRLLPEPLEPATHRKRRHRLPSKPPHLSFT